MYRLIAAVVLATIATACGSGPIEPASCPAQPFTVSYVRSTDPPEEQLTIRIGGAGLGPGQGRACTWTIPGPPGFELADRFEELACQCERALGR